MEQEAEKKLFRGFYGNFQNALDEKSRIFIPSKFREALKPCFMLTVGIESCLIAYRMDDWDNITKVLDRIPFTDTDGRDFLRDFYSCANECPIDKQGRIAVTADLIKHAGLSKEVCFVGVRNYIEVWDFNKWLNKDNEDNKDNGRDIKAEERAAKMQKYIWSGEHGQ